MKRLLLTIFALTLAFTTRAYEPLPLDIDQIDGFHSIRVIGNLSVECLKTTSNPAMHINMMSNDPRRFDWSVKDSVLTISFSANSKSNATLITLWYNTPIQSVEIKRADVQMAEALTAPLLDVTLTEGARFSADVECLDLNLSLSGRSVAKIAGQAKYQTIDVERKSALEAAKTVGNSVELSAAGRSEVYVCATERFVCSSSSRSSVFYDGNPAIVRAQHSGFATINSIGAR